MIFELLTGAQLNLELNTSDSNVLYTTARRQQAINDAQQEFADLTELFTRRSSVTVSCNTAEYDLNSSSILAGSTDFSRFGKAGVEYRLRSSGGAAARWLTWLTGPDFPEVPYHALNQDSPGWQMSTTCGTPASYYLRREGGQLLLGLDTPPAVGSSQSCDLLVNYCALVEPMASSSAEPFTVAGHTATDLRPYHQALVHFAAYRLLPLAGDQVGAQGQLQKFMGYVTRFWSQQRKKGGSQVRLGIDYLRQSRRRITALDDSGLPPSQWG